MNKFIFTENEAAQYITMSRSFLAQDRMNGYRKTRTKGPKYIKVGKNIRYMKEDLDEWLTENKIERYLPDEPVQTFPIQEYSIFKLIYEFSRLLL